MEEVKAEFLRRMETFAKLTKSIEANQNSSNEMLKKAHADEIEQLVRSSNKKYTISCLAGVVCFPCHKDPIHDVAQVQ